jgi:hypothetical protein
MSIQKYSSQELAVVEQACLEIDQIASDTKHLANGVAQNMMDAFKCSALAQKVMDVLSPQVIAMVFQPLRNKEFGWREDRPGTYQAEAIRDVWVGALVKGALPTNDEVLIISGRAYYQKNFFRRKIAQLKGLTDLVILPGKVAMQVNGALVEMTATCKMDGHDVKIARIGASAIPIRLNSGQGADAALGKAERKILCSLYNQLTGSAFAEGEAEETEFVGVMKPAVEVAPSVTVNFEHDNAPESQQQTEPIVKPVMSKTEEVKQQVAAKRGRPAKPKEPVVDDDAPWNQDAPKAVEPVVAQQAPIIEASKQPESQSDEQNFTSAPSVDEVLEEATVITAIKMATNDKGNKVYTVHGHNDETKFTSMSLNIANDAKALAIKSGTYKNKDYPKTPEDEVKVSQKVHGLMQSGGSVIVEYVVNQQTNTKEVVTIKERE